MNTSATAPAMRTTAPDELPQATSLSYESAGSSRPLVGLTIGHALDHVAAAHPDSDAVVSLHENERLTYDRFNRIVDRAARSLLALEIERGDRVAIWSTNSWEWVIAQYATAKIGAILVNINPAYRVHELEFVLRASRAKVLMLIESFKHSDYIEIFRTACPESTACEPGQLHSWRFPDLRSIVFIGTAEHRGMFTIRSFDELADAAPAESLVERRATLDPDDVINVQYTSGTTGFPKGVALTHHNILNNARFIADALNLTDKDRICVPVPFYHCFGMVVSNLAAMTAGAAVIIPAPAFDASATLDAVHRERCTVLHGVPTMFIAELEHPDFNRFDLSSLRTGIMAGAPCPVHLMKQVLTKMHMPELLIAYGMTETSPVSTITHPDDSLERRVETVGRVMPLQEIKIVDKVTGRIVPRGQDGEICFRGYHVMAGYDGLPKETAEAIDAGGWLHSGDVGTMDAAGYIRITGRIKDMVIRGGENIYPREIEEFLLTLEPIREVAVVGVPDEKYGEELFACVVLHDGAAKPTAEAFRTMCKGHIAHMKIPRYWKVVDALPMTVTGKVQRFRVREQAMAESLLNVGVCG